MMTMMTTIHQWLPHQRLYHSFAKVRSPPQCVAQKPDVWLLSERAVELDAPREPRTWWSQYSSRREDRPRPSSWPACCWTAAGVDAVAVRQPCSPSHGVSSRRTELRLRRGTSWAWRTHRSESQDQLPLHWVIGHNHENYSAYSSVLCCLQVETKPVKFQLSP